MQSMKNTLVGIAVGLLVGASVAPAGAHHGTDLRKLTRKVNALQSKVVVLQKKAQLMNRGGFYLGPVVGYQVLSACQPGSTAVWEASAVVADASALDDCIEGQSKQLRASYER